MHSRPSHGIHVVRVAAMLAFALGLSHCGGENDANLVAELGWAFNYRDWTKPRCPDGGGTCTDDDLRACDNQPDEDNLHSLGRAPYPAIATVEVALTDPSGQVPPFFGAFPCADGSGERIKVRGIVRQEYTLTLTAKASDGRTLYYRRDAGLDLSNLVSRTLEVPAASGDLRFTPRYVGEASPLDCAADVRSFRYEIRPQGEQNVVLAGTTADVCDSGLVAELAVHGIPADPESSTPKPHDFTLEALDTQNGTGVVLFCSTQPRYIHPGVILDSQDHNLNPGACP